MISKTRKEYLKEYQRKWIQNRRQEWIDANGPCNKCGSRENLEDDHIDPSLKTVPVATLWSLSKTNPKRVKELENCQVLCEECHQKKTSSEADAKIEHGSYAMRNKYKCICDECLQYVRDAKAASRAKMPYKEYIATK